ncbi:hypothetical protein Avbf_11399 [Armadillidium vulgare]|nr:hypothetical protein Avbf_11399 [Armadillidium vulgare]
MLQGRKDVKRIIYTKHEKEYLIKLVLKHKDIVESKNLQGSALLEKNEAWREIESDFNAVAFHNKRTCKQLKKLWDNLKTEKKKQLSSLKKEISYTGNGSLSQFSDEDPSEDLISSFPTEILDANNRER